MRSIGRFICKYISVAGNVFKEWKRNWGSLFVLIIPALITFPSINEYITQSYWLITVVIALLIIAWLHSNKNIQSYYELEQKSGMIANQRDTLEQTLEDVPRIIVKHLFRKAELDSRDRITIYRYEDDKFINIGRHSDNKEFAKKGRSSYPKDKGFIGQCWHNDYVYKENLPVYSNNPERYLEKVSNKSNIEKYVLKDMAMKSRCFYCRKIYNSKSEPFAVMVVESIKPTLAAKKEIVDEVLDNQFGKLLIESIEINLPVGRVRNNGRN